MISVKSSKYRKPSATVEGVKPAENPKQLGSTSRKSPPKVEGTMEATAGMSTSMPSTSMSNMPITIDTDPMLVGLMPNNYKVLYSLYRDIYYNDAVGGSAVDLFSSLPFGDFSIGGIEDDRILSSFNENIERLGTKTLIPEMAVDQLVLGMHCHSLLYNKQRKVFVDVMPYSPENLSVQTLPFYSQEPIITATFPEQYKTAISQGGPRLERLRRLIGDTVFDKIKAGVLELDPMSTVYIPRKTFSDTDMGVSYYRRLLPIYLIEKNLYRGTLVESARRQRGIMHLTMGDGDNWIPSPDDMDFMVDLFMNADTDPLGAIIATRAGVGVEEIRQGGDFWKVTDFSDSVLSQKLRALSISEAFLSGDANYNVNDSSMTVFLDTMGAYREMMTRKFFYEKLFPLVSMVNGYTVNKKGKIVIKDGLMDKLDPEEAMYMMNDGSRLLIPTVTWSKQLKPDGDNAYMEMLQSLSDKGVPIPLRIMAASGGLSLDDLLKQKDDDLATRKKLLEYKKAIDALSGPPAGEGGEGGDGEDFEAEASALSDDARSALEGMSTVLGRSAVQHGRGKPSILTREFGDAGELHNTSVTGKKSLLINQKAANEKINRRIARAMAGANVRRRMAKNTVQIKRPTK